MFTDAPSIVCLYWAVTWLSPLNNIHLKYLIDSTYRHKVSRFFSLNMCYYDKVPSRNQNPKKIKIGQEPPTTTSKDLRISTATSVAWVAILWLTLGLCGSMQVDALCLDRILKVLRKSGDSFLVISSKTTVRSHLKWNWFFSWLENLKMILTLNDREFVLGFRLHLTVRSSVN